MADAAAGQRGSGLFKAADVRERAHGSELNSAAEGSCQTTAQLAGKGWGEGESLSLDRRTNGYVQTWTWRST